MSHPYHDFEGTLLWNLINNGINDLSNNQDINEMTRREYIVGYLYSQLKDFIKTELDGAEIVELSNKGSYGYIIDEDGNEIEISYLAVCNYKGKSEFYLFACDNRFNVIGDTVHSSIEEAKATKNNDFEINWTTRI
ncbi:hypothetical protein D7Z26_10270 [Cohnella endophytica]|uniref:Uncharacterized protein n=1 Tax=Cohnella endophytica TaxID=2419778 RepID=A0A494Y0N5_9BACL|nr:hypothetical protein [Cohnella endophytica]RKP55558.1 hypothetical protein D7Z26_10270 [Cohnella endophytica]